jgi:threonine-phosphate decarboxylase
MLNGHGDDRYQFNKEIIADFSSNVYYEGLSAGLKQQLSRSLDKLNNYPEVNAQSLQQALAAWHSLAPSQVLVTNGATEAFYLVAHAFRNKSATIFIPAFAEYEDACSANDITVQYITEIQDFYSTDLVFFGNPNNPTGAVLPTALLSNILKTNPDTVFVIDEAYVDFTSEKVSMAAHIADYSNLIIIRSLTKTYSIPGLRLGYLLSNAGIINNILRYKMPWSVNALAVEAGLYITQHKTALPLDTLLKDTRELMQQLSPYVTVFDSHTNFFLCHTSKGTAADLKLFLLNDGVLIRDAANFKSLNAGHFRIATQTRDKNALLVKLIQAWINS